MAFVEVDDKETAEDGPDEEIATAATSAAGQQSSHAEAVAAAAPSAISFLYQLTPGLAQRSYGLNVARLAGYVLEWVPFYLASLVRGLPAPCTLLLLASPLIFCNKRRSSLIALSNLSRGGGRRRALDKGQLWQRLFPISYLFDLCAFTRAGSFLVISHRPVDGVMQARVAALARAQSAAEISEVLRQMK